MGAGTEPDGSSRSDEEWERFLRESVAGAADSPKEPSARARVPVACLTRSPSRAAKMYHPRERIGQARANGKSATAGVMAGRGRQR